MRTRGWAAVVLGVALAAALFAGGRSQRGARDAVPELLGAGAADAAFAAGALPALRFAVPLAGGAALVLELQATAGAAPGGAAALAVSALLGVPGEWPLAGSGALAAPGLAGVVAAAAPVPEPSALVLLALGTAGLAAGRRAAGSGAGRGAARLSP